MYNSRFEIGEAVVVAEGRFRNVCGPIVAISCDGGEFAYYVDAEDCDSVPFPETALRSLKSVIGTKPVSEDRVLRKECLEKAIDIVCGDRERDYGKPEDNLGVIADLWTAYLTRVFGDVTEIDREDVAVMMSLLKIGRIAGKHFKADSMIDGAAYLALAYEVGMQKKAEKKHES